MAARRQPRIHLAADLVLISKEFLYIDFSLVRGYILTDVELNLIQLILRIFMTVSCQVICWPLLLEGAVTPAWK